MCTSPWIEPSGARSPSVPWANIVLRDRWRDLYWYVPDGQAATPENIRAAKRKAIVARHRLAMMIDDAAIVNAIGYF